MGLSSKIVASAPFGIAILMYAISPELSNLVRKLILHRIQEAETLTRPNDPTPVPPHLTPEYIGDYVEYAGDAAQIATATLVTLFGMVAAVVSGIPVVAAVMFWMLGIPGSMFLIARTLTTDPSKYVSRKIWRRYSEVAAVGIVLNIVAILMVFGLT